MSQTNRWMLQALSAALLVAPLAPAWASEGGSTEYIGGFTGFAAGFVPPKPGTYFSNDVYFYTAKADVLTANGNVALDLDTSAIFEIPIFTWVTSKKVLGGDYGFGFALPLGNLEVDVGLPPLGLDMDESTFGLGDAIVIPALIGWHHGDWHTNFTMSVFVPIGKYDADQPVNLSKNYWAIDAAYGFSYLTPTGLDVSGSLGYTTNFRNKTTDYDSGDVVHLDLAIGRSLTKAFKLGVLGYAIKQVSGDSGSGAVLGSFKSDIYAAGLGAGYANKLGSKDVNWQLRWYHEFDGKNHLEGDGIFLTAALEL